MELLIINADEIGLADDPQFRSVFARHIERGTGLAVINLNLGKNPATDEEAIPEWEWGEVKGPSEVGDSLFQKKKND